ncbi:MAG TPA: clostripain-related cysteine peptidase [candidate division Zixibacteria bacterium]|nr:clostripain-related cysteine peptidase [candidate division Zixibacteria bacterium]
MSILNNLFSQKKKRISSSIILLTLFILVFMISYISPSQAYNKEIGMISTQFKQESAVEINAPPHFDWVVMNYIDGDNNLEAEAIDDLNEMESEFNASANVAVIVLIDRTNGYDDTNGDWETTRLYNVTYDVTADIDSTLLQDMGELNMGDGEVLEDFIDYCFANLEADHYWLNLWDHGGGVDGICWDDTSGGDSLTIDEMQTAISASETTYGKYIDVISHDACFMNMIEVAYELKDLSDYFVGSEESVPGDGFDYEAIISGLVADTTMNASTLANLMVDSYESFYDGIVDYVTLSALNLTIMDQFILATNNFAGNLSLVIADGQGSGIEEAFYETLKFYDDYSIDFMDFVVELDKNSTLMSNYPNLDTSVTNLLAEFPNLIINNYQDSIYSGDANGVSIFMPIMDNFIDTWIENYIDTNDLFSGMDWQAFTFWEEFLEDFYTAGYGERTFEFDEMFLDTTVGPLSLSEEDDIYYYIAISETALYEITCNVLSGDADLYLYDEVALEYFIAWSCFYNPEDGSNEKIRLLLAPGYYFVNVNAWTACSVTFEMTTITIPELDLDTPVSETSGSQEGDENGHYLQIFYHYYSFTADIEGNYTFTLTYSSYSVDFDLYLLNNEFIGLDSSEETGDTDSIFITASIGETFYVVVYGYSGYGTFSLEVTSPDISESPTPTDTISTFGFNGFTIILSTIGILAASMYILVKQKKKIN